MKNIKPIIILITVFAIAISGIYAQEVKKKVSEMTKEELMELNYDDLLSLSFEDLILVANKFGLSSDELLEYFLNKEVTSASKRAEKSLNSPLSSTVVSRDEIINSGATNIPEALRLVPGIIVREKTPGNYDVHIRGNDNIPPKNIYVYSENAISLVMIDGRPVYNYGFGGTLWETLPIDLIDVDRIEVIRGPSSALYGPNAVSGVVNIITRKIESNKPHIETNVQKGNINATIANMSASIGLTKKLRVRVTGNYTNLNRFDDKLFVFGTNRFHPKSELDTMTYGYLAKTNQSKMQSYFAASDSMKKVFTHSDTEDPLLATDKYGVNAFFYYSVNKDFGINMAVGAQGSKIRASELGSNESSLMGRNSTTQYFDIRSHIYGFQVQANCLFGDQDFEKEKTGWRLTQPVTLNTSLEYEHTLGSLILRPGISYQSAAYDDSKFIDVSKHEGFLNGRRNLNTFAYYMRADYKAFEKLRLIAAIRGDKYNKPDKNYFTYQFIASYDLNAKNVVRGVYSRANRGPFIVDIYADYDWIVVPDTATTVTPYKLKWRGNENLKLPVMDMIEIGYRTQPVKNIMVEIEAFRTELKNISYFMPDSLSVYFDFSTFADTTINQPTMKYLGHIQYYNFDLKSIQTGITCNLSIAVNKNLNFKIFGTIQKTSLENLYNKTYWDNLGEMSYSLGLLSDSITNYFTTEAMQAGARLSELVPRIENGTATLAEMMEAQAILDKKPAVTVSNEDIVNGKINKDSLINTKNESTPSFYGGVSVDFTPIKKLNINTSLYFYGKQTFLNERVDFVPTDEYYKIAQKYIVNLKISYKFWKENSIYFNARNVLNDDKREFGFLDNIKGLYLIGLDLKF